MPGSPTQRTIPQRAIPQRPISQHADEPPASRSLAWSHGTATLQTLGGMLAPVVFCAPGHPEFSPLQVAPWADEPGAEQWPGGLRRLRGEWPCVPFGRCDRPADLPPAWAAREPGDAWGHGYATQHSWQWLTLEDPLTLGLQIEPPPEQAVERLTRTVRAVDGEAALEMALQIDVRRECSLPVALHPTLRLDAGRVELALAHTGPGLTYPVPAEPGHSRLRSDARFERLNEVPLAEGLAGDAAASRADGTDGTDAAPGGPSARHADLTRYPQPQDSEELLLLMDLQGPVTAHYLDAGWSLTLDWDRSALPDLMLWVSHRGRLYPPWNGRHWALGLEPLNGAFDLGRVAQAPAGHPLAIRQGLRLSPARPTVLRYRLAATPATGASR